MLAKVSLSLDWRSTVSINSTYSTREQRTYDDSLGEEGSVGAELGQILLDGLAHVNGTEEESGGESGLVDDEVVQDGEESGLKVQDGGGDLTALVIVPWCAGLGVGGGLVDVLHDLVGLLDDLQGVLETDGAAIGNAVEGRVQGGGCNQMPSAKTVRR